MHLSDTCADDSNFGKVGDRSSCCCAGDAERAKRRTTQGNKRRMQKEFCVDVAAAVAKKSVEP